MSMSPSHRILPLHFRHDIVSRLFALAQAGESASVVGVSGTGKSNLFNHLLNPAIQSHFLGAEAFHFLFVRIDCHNLLDFSVRAILSLFLEELRRLEERREDLGLDDTLFHHLDRYHEALIAARDDLLRVQYSFGQAVRPFLAGSQRRLIFLVDQFDELPLAVDPRLFTLLRGLRESYKDRLAYLVFTRNTLAAVMSHDLAREELYELMAANVLGLGPYERRDARLMLERIAQRHGLTVPEAAVELLIVASGGHAGLLRASLFAARSHLDELAATAGPIPELLAHDHNVNAECAKIWASLTLEEQQLLAAVAQGAPLDWPESAAYGAPLDPAGLLTLKGLLHRDRPNPIFSPLFGHYARRAESVWERPLYLDPVSRRAWVCGRIIPDLTLREYNLLKYFTDHAAEVISKDELVEAGWPEKKGDVSDESLTSAIYRLRNKIEPDPRKPRFILNEREVGYRLTLD
jgi:hypothetical protein